MNATFAFTSMSSRPSIYNSRITYFSMLSISRAHWPGLWWVLDGGVLRFTPHVDQDITNSVMKGLYEFGGPPPETFEISNGNLSVLQHIWGNIFIYLLSYKLGQYIDLPNI